MTEGHGVCNGSFGEILQGVLPSGQKFLVNLPITLESRATVTLLSSAYDREKEDRFAVAYMHHPKAHKAVLTLMKRRGYYGHDFALSIASEIPIGKGLSSSTADMTAALRAFGQATSNVSFPDIDDVLRQIEPNDGIHYPGTAVYAHADGCLIAQYDYIPPWTIVGVDAGGEVDTVSFNARSRVWPDEAKVWWEWALSEARDGLEHRDAEALARIATLSTDRWQQTHPKSHYPSVRTLLEETDALGVVNTHSGTYLGLIYPRGQDVSDIVALARERMPECAVQVFETKA
jgi:L-threonine kinase